MVATSLVFIVIVIVVVVSTITEAILFHGGEGRASRDAFEAASEYDRTALVTFLKSLQIVPDGAGEDL